MDRDSPGTNTDFLWFVYRFRRKNAFIGLDIGALCLSQETRGLGQHLLATYPKSSIPTHSHLPEPPFHASFCL